MKERIVGCIYSFPIIRGIIKKIEMNRNYIKNLEKENELLRNQLKNIEKKIQNSDMWLKRTREDMWELNSRTHDRIKDNYNKLSTGCGEINQRVEQQKKQLLDIIQENKGLNQELNKELGKRLDESVQKNNDLKKWLDDTRNKMWETKALYKNLEYRLYKYMSYDKYEEALADWFYSRTSERLNLSMPQTFNEKIQWLKLYDNSPEKTILADKYLVREYVANTIGDQYLIPLLGVWDSVEEIDFDSLPNSFVLKANHGSAMNIIVKDKKLLDISLAKTKMKNWLAVNYAYNGGFELQYAKIPPKIIAEQYIEHVDDLRDYKFLCFGGEVKYVWVDSSRYKDHRRDFFDLQWNHLDVAIAYPNAEEPPIRPANLEKMVELAGQLCQGFIHVRVDLYDVNGQIYFGEMTFTSGNGTEKFTSQEFAYQLGSLIELPMDK